MASTIDGEGGQLGVTINTSAVRAAGKVAKDIATGNITNAKDEVYRAEDDVSSAKIGELDSKKSLDEVCFQWQVHTGGLALAVESVGDKLVTTASTYEQGDDDSADVFKDVKHEPRPHEDPRR